MDPLRYPTTRQTEDRDELAGVSFPDPYRWLESEADEVHRWQRAQAELAAGQVCGWKHFPLVRRWVSHFSADMPALPRKAGGRWFRIAPVEGLEHSAVVIATTPSSAGRILYDPRSEGQERPPLVSWIAPSPDGQTLAVGICSDGSENNSIRLIDVAAGTLRADAPSQVLMDNWLGGVQWLADSSGFFYTALIGGARDLRQAIYFHRLGEQPPTAPVRTPLPEAERDWSAVIPSRCGRWAVAIHRMMTPVPAAVRDLRDPQSEWRPFITNITGTAAGYVLNDRYVAVTDIDAPRGRIVAIPLDSPRPDDPMTWEELVPESEAVIRGLTPVGETLYVSDLVDTYSRVRVFGMNGSPMGEVPLPSKGVLFEPFAPMMSLFSRGDADSFIFAFSSLIRSWGIYCHHPGHGRIETITESQTTIEGAVVEDRSATSTDGTRIPYHVVRLRDCDASEPRAALIQAYGGFKVPYSPQFPGPAAALVAAGGLLVHAHLRGGGEFGAEWWQRGRMQHKQNCYADLYAVAEDLISCGVTSSERLGLTGSSNGGLLAGVAITQRPDLWRVVVPRVPFIDLIGACREGYGRGTIAVEYANPDDADEVRRLATFSPYHLVKPRASYPAVYIDAGETDPRCPPWHARKLAARLQAAQAGKRPILLHVWANAGHGLATSRHVLLEENAEWLAFVLLNLGLTPPVFAAPAPSPSVTHTDSKDSGARAQDPGLARPHP